MCDKNRDANPMDELFRVVHSFKRLNMAEILPDITHAELGTLSMICRCSTGDSEQGVRISEVVSHMRVAPPAVSRTLKSLEEKEYIERTIDRKDRRNTFVKLTEKGMAILQESESIMYEFGRAVFGEMGEENINRLIAYLKNMLEVSEREIAKRKYRDRKDEPRDEKDI